MDDSTGGGGGVAGSPARPTIVDTWLQPLADSACGENLEYDDEFREMEKAAVGRPPSQFEAEGVAPESVSTAPRPCPKACALSKGCSPASGTTCIRCRTTAMPTHASTRSTTCAARPACSATCAIRWSSTTARSASCA